MTDKLTDEQRAQVAMYCGWFSFQKPLNRSLFRDLTQKVADLARVTGNPSTFLRVLDAIATDNTDALESMCWELMPEDVE